MLGGSSGRERSPTILREWRFERVRVEVRVCMGLVYNTGIKIVINNGHEKT